MKAELQVWGALLAVIISLLTIAGQLVGWGKFIEKLNGLGGRVKDLDNRVTRGEEKINQQTLIQQRFADEQGRQVENLAKLEAKIDACFKQNDEHQRGIIAKFDSFLQRKSDDHIAIRERLARMEQQLDDRKKNDI